MVLRGWAFPKLWEAASGLTPYTGLPELRQTTLHGVIAVLGHPPGNSAGIHIGSARICKLASPAVLLVGLAAYMPTLTCVATNWSHFLWQEVLPSCSERSKVNDSVLQSKLTFTRANILIGFGFFPPLALLPDKLFSVLYLLYISYYPLWDIWPLSEYGTRHLCTWKLLMSPPKQLL